MKVVHVISDINRSSGGPSRSSQGLVAGLNKLGVETWLVALHKSDQPWVVGVTRFEALDGADRFTELLERILPDIVHLHGIWSLELHAIARICQRDHIPYVIAPRGMLEPWSLKQKWLKKRIARFLYQDHDLHQAAALHATAESETEQFRKLGFKNPVIISPNGVNLPKSTPTPKTYTSDKKRRALFVSRMHPKKGVLELVESWSRVFSHGERVEHGEWECELVYTLNGDTEREYESKVKQRILDLGMSYQDIDGTLHCQPQPPTSTSLPNFILTGPLNDDEKWKAYARADLFVLPTYSENFGIVVAEALYAGVPVITTKGTPWQELETHHCGWWIDLPKGKVRGEGEQWNLLDNALREATSISTSDLNLLGQNGHALVEAKYTWSAASKSVLDGYKRILRENCHGK